MLLTIRTTHRPATDLGYLLAKNPARAQSFDLSFGQAHVFYPEAEDDACTAALLLDVDPVGLVRGKAGSAEGGALDQYVNDRPYVASSFLSVALAQTLGSALAGRSRDRPELADTAIPLEARIAVLPCRGGEALLRRLFEPLGWDVTAEAHPLDPAEPAWGDSRYFTVTLRGTRRLAELLSHLYVLVPVLDGGALVVAHAGMKEEMQGRGSGRVREFALYGETTGETDEFGLPVRWDWAREYRGAAAVVYGHTPVPVAEWVNGTINVDTGCVFGGRLTALRWPERELVSVPAGRVYAEPARPFLPVEEEGDGLSTQHLHDDLLDLADVSGKRIIETRLRSNVTVREENAAAALEVMSRFACNPRWLVYLPPTMSPSETATEGGLLEHPSGTFGYFRAQGVARVVCQEKHMGSRAVVVVCRDEDAARRRFGVVGEGIGVVYTRTGRRFFDDASLEGQVLSITRDALSAAGFWEELATEWAVLDCELMPWSAKAQELIRGQYAAVGAAARASLGAAGRVLGAAAERGVDLGPLRERFGEREQLAADYVAAYRRYCWPVAGVDDLRLAPFHVLATEGAVHTDRDHRWHMETAHAICRGATRLLHPTAYREVELADEGSVAAATAWWEEMTERGGEGMVVKPLEFVARGRRGVVQPAVKCRGREYLRIIYGPEYTLPGNLERLRQRGLGAKRSLALREFALGVEGLERFVRGEPLRRVHECVFGVLALESEPVDPRL